MRTLTLTHRCTLARVCADKELQEVVLHGRMDFLPAMRGLASHPNLTSVRLNFDNYGSYYDDDDTSSDRVRSLFEALPNAVQTVFMSCPIYRRKSSLQDKSQVICSQLPSCAKDSLTSMCFSQFYSLQHFIGQVPSTVQHIEFRLMRMAQADVLAFLARHPHVRSLKFTECTMAEDVCLKCLCNQNPGCVITVVPGRA